ncbi:hypothetical protein ACN47E_010070 [Coniothyrium glycines]
MGNATLSAQTPRSLHSSQYNHFYISYNPSLVIQNPVLGDGEMAERSKALASGASREICVGSNPTLINIGFFFWRGLVCCK